MLYPPLNPTEFSQRYGIFCFPILADLTVYSLLSRATTAAKAQIASLVGGLVTGIGLAYLFADRTSLITGLIGAGLYLAYKVGAYFFLFHLQQVESSPLDLTQSMANLQQEYQKFQQQMTLTSDAAFNYSLDVVFERELRAHLGTLNKNDVLLKWTDQTDQMIGSILNQCQTILLQIYGTLEKETETVKHNHNGRLLKMAALLKDPHWNPNHAFGKALLIFYRSYFLFQRKGYVVHLPGLQYAIKDENNFLIIGSEAHNRSTQISDTFEHLDKQLKGLIGIVFRTHTDKAETKLVLPLLTGPTPYIITIPPLSDTANKLGF